LFGLGFYLLRHSLDGGEWKGGGQIGPILAKIHINFIGPLRVFLGAQTVTVDIHSIDEARDYVESHYGLLYEKKLKSMGVNKKQSIWDNSVFLLNGKNIGQVDEIVLKDGDKLDLMLLVAGG
jgi:molybdopterin converting factor small subunit